MKTANIKKDIFFPKNIARILVVFCLLACNNACTSLQKVPDTQLKPVSFPKMEISENIVDTSKAAPIGDYENYKKDIVEYVNKNLQSIDKEQHDVYFNISKIKLETRGSRFTGGQFIVMLISTPGIPFSLIKSSHSVSYSVYYSVSDKSGKTIYHKELKGKVAGGYRGWSILRLAFRSQLLEQQGIAVAKDVARLISDDMFQNYSQIVNAVKPMAIMAIDSAPKANISSNKPLKNIQISDIDINIPRTDRKNSSAVAVIIGNSAYSSNDIPAVDFASKDADIVRQYLEKTLGYRDGNIIFELNATKAKLESIFGTTDNYKGKLYNWLQRGKSDIFVYYSGHGAPNPESKEGYFVPSDADPQSIALTGYPLQQLYNNIAKISSEMQSPNIYIVIDACFSGATEKGLLLKNVSPIYIEVKNPLMTLTNAVVMTSAAGAEVSSWYPDKGHSMFTYFLLKGLKESVEAGKSTVTAGDLFDSVTNDTDGVPYWARRLNGRIQTPQIVGDRNRVFFSNK
ncbi:MAG: caspase family protein [Thermodesulfovibrionales bacterium]|nr:caspase family protein [Thermodesulfovibrionales bacterium]